MSKRDPLRPYMNIIDNMLLQMVVLLLLYSFKYSLNYFFLLSNIKYTVFQLKEDPSFRPQGGRLGENDMDYDTDEKTMATLRRQLRGAREEYYRYRR